MNYLQYYPIDVVNGPGTRATLFVAGCSHGCKGCYNQSGWSPKSGVEFTQEMEDQIIADLSDVEIFRRGLSLSGGDPLMKYNMGAIKKLIGRVRKECPTKDIWMWTGYTMDQLNEDQKEIVEMVDVLIEGKFEQDQKDPKLHWRGSSNQVITYIKPT